MIGQRMQQKKRDFHEKYDIAVARAVSFTKCTVGIVPTFCENWWNLCCDERRGS